MKHGSLFSGIGGFDLAAQWMGWQNVFHCEMNPFGQQVLKYYWPDAELFEDITKTDFTKYHGTIDIISGGFPCQPYSTAGKRLGKEDERHLWPEMLRAIREVQPTWVVGENVSGLISWNGGVVFDEVQADLEAAGYEVVPFILPACGVNAPHRRDRVWFVAYRNDTGADKQLRTDGIGTAENNRREGFAQPEIRTDGFNGSTPHPHHTGESTGLGGIQKANGEIPQWDNDAESGNAGDGITTYSKVDGCQATTDINWRQEYKSNIRPGIRDTSNTNGNIGDAPNPGSIGQQGQGRYAQSGNSTESRNGKADWANYDNERWERFPTQPPVCSRNDELPSKLVGITVSKHRQESIKGYGNAVVPAVVLQIFKAIEEYEKLNK